GKFPSSLLVPRASGLSCVALTTSYARWRAGAASAIGEEPYRPVSCMAGRASPRHPGPACAVRGQGDTHLRRHDTLLPARWGLHSGCIAATGQLPVEIVPVRLSLWFRRFPGRACAPALPLPLPLPLPLRCPYSPLSAVRPIAARASAPHLARDRLL